MSIPELLARYSDVGWNEHTLLELTLRFINENAYNEMGLIDYLDDIAETEMN